MHLRHFSGRLLIPLK